MLVAWLNCVLKFLYFTKSDLQNITENTIQMYPSTKSEIVCNINCLQISKVGIKPTYRKSKRTSFIPSSNVWHHLSDKQKKQAISRGKAKKYSGGKEDSRIQLLRSTQVMWNSHQMNNQDWKANANEKGHKGAEAKLSQNQNETSLLLDENRFKILFLTLWLYHQEKWTQYLFSKQHFGISATYFVLCHL